MRSFLLFCMIASACTLVAQQPAVRPAQTNVEAMQLRPLPQEIIRRHAVLSAKLQPSTRMWVQQRAFLESKKSSPDVTALKADAKSHFQATNPNLSGADIEAVAFLVMMEASKSAEEDLKSIMDGVKLINKQKEALRSALNDVNQLTAASGKTPPSTPCTVPLCRSLSSRISQIQSQSPASPRLRRLQLRPNPTYADLNAARIDIKSNLDSLSEMGETESMRLQMAMDRQSKMMATLSNILKKMSDTNDSIVQNIK
jgi:hypothetical protein